MLGTLSDTDANHSFSEADARAVTLYADAGTHLFVGATASAITDGSAAIYLSGYLVPMP
jgi:hypothetical protein